MIHGVMNLLPFCPAGHIGIYRDKFIHNTVEYYFKIPDLHKGKDILIVAPMVATGDTIIACIDRLREFNVGKIKLMCILISPEAIERLEKCYEDVDIYFASREEGLNEQRYLVPGLGDAGDRLYKTK